MINTGAGGPDWERPLSKPGAADPIHTRTPGNEGLHAAMFAAGTALFYAGSAKGQDLSTTGKRVKWFLKTTVQFILWVIFCLVVVFGVIAGVGLGFLWLLENA